MIASMTSFRPLLVLLGALFLGATLPSSATAQDADGDIDEESLLEKARPMVKDLYLHPDAVDPPRMLRSTWSHCKAQIVELNPIVKPT